MIWFLVLAASAVLVYWAGWRLKNKNLLEKASTVPGPPTIPVLGNALKFIVPSEEFYNALGQMTEEYGHIFRFWLGPDLNYCVTDPDDVKILLTSYKTTAKGPQYKYMLDLLGYGILSGSGPVWRKRRKILSPNYSRKATVNYGQVFNQEAECLLGRLKTRPRGQSFNIYEEVVKTTTYTVCQTLFGLTREQTLNLPHLQTIVDQTHLIYLGVFKRMTTWHLQIKPLYWLSSYYSQYRKFSKMSLNMGEAIVKHRLQVLKSKNNKIGMGSDSYNNYSDGEISDLSTVDKLIFMNDAPNHEDMLKQVFTIFTTSQETSANIASFLLLMAAYHSECQDKLYEEIKCVYGDVDREVTDEDLRRMPYLEMVFKEVIRLFPIGSLLQRTVMEDIEISHGITLPAGSSLAVSIFHMHRDKEFWVNPEAFDPERFSEENSKLRHPHCYIPFSLGSMDCVGRHFGTKLVKTISIRVLREYRLTSPEAYEDLKLVCAVSVESLRGYPVYLNPRHA